MAARLGVEPRQNESESFVLPLHHQAISLPEIYLLGPSAELEPTMGFEPATVCLQNRCSTIELRRQVPIIKGSECAGSNEKTPEFLANGGSPGARTRNQLIKSQLLYH